MLTYGVSNPCIIGIKIPFDPNIMIGAIRKKTTAIERNAEGILNGRQYINRKRRLCDVCRGYAFIFKKL